MYDVHGKSVDGKNKGRMQAAVDEWEKTAKKDAGKTDFDEDSFDSEVKNIVKSKIKDVERTKPKIDFEKENAAEKINAQPENQENAPVIPGENEPRSQTGAKKEDTPESDAEAKDDESPLDYDNLGDADEIIGEQHRLLTSLIVRFSFCFIFAAALALLAVEPILKLPFLSVVDIKSHTLYYIAANTALLILAGIVGAPVAFSGIADLFTFTPDNDSVASLAFYAALVGDILCICSNVLSAGSFALPAAAAFSACAAASLAFNFFGKIFLISRVKKNLEFISDPQTARDGFYSASILDEKRSRGLLPAFDGIPSIVTYTKVDFLSDFLEKSYAVTPSDSASKVLGPVALIIAIISAALEVVLKKDIAGATTVFCAVCCAASPLMLGFGVSVPFYCAANRLLKKEALVTGCETVSQFGNADAAMAEGNLIFPGNSLTIYSVKTFGNYKIEEVMLNAASIAYEGKSPIAAALMAMFAGGKADKNILRPVEKLCYEDEKGLSGLIDGKMILLGNRGILRRHLIEAPSRDFEFRMTENGRDLAYLAIDGEICAAFILGYRLDEKTSAHIRRLHRYGIKLLVRSTDPNVSPQLLEEKSKVPSQDTIVFGAREMQILKGSLEEKRQPAGLAFKDIEGYAAELVSCVKLKGSFCANTALSCVFAVFGIILVLYSAFFAGGAAAVSPLYLLAYEVICALPVLVISLIRRC